MKVIDKKEISKILNDIGLMLELKGENPFKVNAYYNGARKIEVLAEDIRTIVAEGRLKEIPGIGDALAEKIRELLETGELKYYQELARDLPPGLFDLLRVPGLGPKKVSQLYKELHITNLSELEYACKENQLIELSGFGEKTQEKVLKGVKNLQNFIGQHLYANVIRLAERILHEVLSWPEVLKAELAGSIRRKKEMIKDIDIVCATTEPEKVMKRLSNADFVKEVISSGLTKTAVVLSEGINMDLRAVTPDEYVYALHHFTGSKEHNTAMRGRAKDLGLKINEYGIFRGEERIECQDETEFFKILGLDYIPPELREDQGEIVAAEKGELPVLIRLEDLRGVFHSHTRYSDGVDSIPELVRACRERGLNYLGISDHSKTAIYANGLSEADLKAQWVEIDALNAEFRDFWIFKGIESEILGDGSLDYPEEILREFDFVIASIHTNFSRTEEQVTNQILRAIENPYTTMLGHPTGRLLLDREGYQVDIYRIIRACAEHGVIIELNANPRRLDLDWRFCKYAIEQGVLISINPDAHQVSGLDDLEFGVAVARKGWLSKANVFNVRTVAEIQAYLLKKKGKFSQAKIQEKVVKILEFFDQEYPDATCSLNWANPFQLLIATILSAQCTDKRVNEVTKELFKKYRDPEAFAKANPTELEEAIRSTGFFRNKARNIIQCSQELVTRYGGEVPKTMEELIILGGVGRKTANVVLGDAFAVPGIVVDTHAKRLSQRLGLTREENPEKIEFDLQKLIPQEKWTKFCHQLINHGRSVCMARGPKCEICELNMVCDYPKQGG